MIVSNTHLNKKSSNFQENPPKILVVTSEPYSGF